MKHILSLLLTLVITQVAWSQMHVESHILINGLYYYLYDDTHEAMVENGNTWEGDLEIPSTVTYEGKDYTVTKIDWMGFCYCQTLTSITIPETLNKIVCMLPQQGQPFDGCDHLESITVKEGNQGFCSEDGILYNKDKTKLICYPAASKRQSFSVPYGVKVIGEGAFAYCQNLTAVSFPETVNSMERFAFHFSEALQQVVLSDSISMIRQNTFQCCSNLKTIIFPKNLKKVEALAFHRCFSLERVSFPDSLQEIESCVFHSCSSLRVVDFPAAIRKIGNACFDELALDTLVIRGTLEYGRETVFSGMLASPIVYVPQSEIDKYKAIYSGTVLPLTSYHPNSIQNLQMTKQSPSPATLFDLSGRSLSAPPAKGFFIQDGQKVVR